PPSAAEHGLVGRLHDPRHRPQPDHRGCCPRRERDRRKPGSREDSRQPGNRPVHARSRPQRLACDTMSKWIVDVNGISVALVMGVVNAGLAMLLSFGVNLSESQAGTIQAFVNALLVAVVAVAHQNAKHTKTVIPAPP